MTYDGIDEKDWREELDGVSVWNQRHALALFSFLGLPESMLDVGCGDGTMVYTARKLGVDAYGVDQLVDAATPWAEHFFHHNLVDLFLLERHSTRNGANMVLCLEVAEHLHPTAHPTLCDTLAVNLLAGSGNYLVFSSAFPNQGGMGHVAERPSKYWLDELSMRGMNFRKDLTVALSLLWNNIGSPLYWLPANVMIFEK